MYYSIKILVQLILRALQVRDNSCIFHDTRPWVINATDVLFTFFVFINAENKMIHRWKIKDFRSSTTSWLRFWLRKFFFGGLRKFSFDELRLRHRLRKFCDRDLRHRHRHRLRRSSVSPQGPTSKSMQKDELNFDLDFSSDPMTTVDLIYGTRFHGLSMTVFKYPSRTHASLKSKCRIPFHRRASAIDLVFVQCISFGMPWHHFFLNPPSCVRIASKNCIYSIVIDHFLCNYLRLFILTSSGVSMSCKGVLRYRWIFNPSQLWWTNRMFTRPQGTGLTCFECSATTTLRACPHVWHSRMSRRCWMSNACRDIISSSWFRH